MPGNERERPGPGRPRAGGDSARTRDGAGREPSPRLVVSGALRSSGDPRFVDARLTALPTTEGGANHNFRVRAAGGVFYAKLAADPRETLTREQSALALLGARAPRDAGWPTLALARPGLVVTEALAGRELPDARAFEEPQLAQVAQALARLHRTRVPGTKPGPLVGGATAPALVRTCEDLAARVEASLDAGAARALRSRVRAARRHMERTWWDVPTPRALCHGDVRPANVLFHGGRAAFIDFELCGRGDPLIDVARFVSYAALRRHQELCVLDAYAEATGAPHLERYFCYRPLMPLFSALVATDHVLAVQSGARRPVDPGYAAQRARVATGLLEAAIDAPVGRLTRR